MSGLIGSVFFGGILKVDEQSLHCVLEKDKWIISVLLSDIT